MVSIVFSNIVFVLVRNCRKEVFAHKFRSLDSSDTKQDYISTMQTQFSVNIFAQSTNNVLIYAFIKKSEFLNSEFLDGEHEERVLNVQFGMQCAQLLFVLILMFTPLRSSRACGCWFKGGPVVHWCLAHITFAIIPVASLIYWVAELKTVTEGFLAPWFILYPLMNLLTLFPIYPIILDIMRIKK